MRPTLTSYVSITVALWLPPEQLKRVNVSQDENDTPVYAEVIDAHIPLRSRKGL